jgi:dienelactone hydrolase
MSAQIINLQHEGAELRGQLFRAETKAPHAAVLIMPTAVGISDHELLQARRLVEAGYVALVADMYGGGIHHVDPKTAGENFVGLLNAPTRLRARVVAWFECLRSQPDIDAERIAAIGYCFGGRCVLELARSGADIKAAVSFHGLLTTTMPAAPGAIKGEVVIYTGSKDPYAPREDLDALRQELSHANARWHITEFGTAAHAFTEPNAASYGKPGVAYDAIAARTSWAGTLALLAEVIG